MHKNKANFRDVFINCPFDKKYRPTFRAIVFTIVDCGFRPRCALEIDDSTGIRIEKILDLVSRCKFGIHDLSRTELSKSTKLPRFNMPLELGIFLGAARLGNPSQRRKVGLILDKNRYRFQKFISDIAGQDIHEHKGIPKNAVAEVRGWLRSS